MMEGSVVSDTSDEYIVTHARLEEIFKIAHRRGIEFGIATAHVDEIDGWVPTLIEWVKSFAREDKAVSLARKCEDAARLFTQPDGKSVSSLLHRIVWKTIASIGFYANHFHHTARELNDSFFAVSTDAVAMAIATLTSWPIQNRLDVLKCFMEVPAQTFTFCSYVELASIFGASDWKWTPDSACVVEATHFSFALRQFPHEVWEFGNGPVRETHPHTNAKRIHKRFLTLYELETDHDVDLCRYDTLRWCGRLMLLMALHIIQLDAKQFCLLSYLVYCIWCNMCERRVIQIEDDQRAIRTLAPLRENRWWMEILSTLIELAASDELLDEFPSLKKRKDEWQPRWWCFKTLFHNNNEEARGPSINRDPAYPHDDIQLLSNLFDKMDRSILIVEVASRGRLWIDWVKHDKTLNLTYAQGIHPRKQFEVSFRRLIRNLLRCIDWKGIKNPYDPLRHLRRLVTKLAGNMDSIPMKAVVQEFQLGLRITMATATRLIATPTGPYVRQRVPIREQMPYQWQLLLTDLSKKMPTQMVVELMRFIWSIPELGEQDRLFRRVLEQQSLWVTNTLIRHRANVAQSTNEATTTAVAAMITSSESTLLASSSPSPVSTTDATNVINNPLNAIDLPLHYSALLEEVRRYLHSGNATEGVAEWILLSREYLQQIVQDLYQMVLDAENDAAINKAYVIHLLGNLGQCPSWNVVETGVNETHHALALAVLLSWPVPDYQRCFKIFQRPVIYNEAIKDWIVLARKPIWPYDSQRIQWLFSSHRITSEVIYDVVHPNRWVQGIKHKCQFHHTEALVECIWYFIYNQKGKWDQPVFNLIVSQMLEGFAETRARGPPSTQDRVKSITEQCRSMSHVFHLLQQRASSLPKDQRFRLRWWTDPNSDRKRLHTFFEGLLFCRFPSTTDERHLDVEAVNAIVGFVRTMMGWLDWSEIKMPHSPIQRFLLEVDKAAKIRSHIVFDRQFVVAAKQTVEMATLVAKANYVRKQPTLIGPYDWQLIPVREQLSPQWHMVIASFDQRIPSELVKTIFSHVWYLPEMGKRYTRLIDSLPAQAAWVRSVLAPFRQYPSKKRKELENENTIENKRIRIDEQGTALAIGVTKRDNAEADDEEDDGRDDINIPLHASPENATELEELTADAVTNAAHAITAASTIRIFDLQG